MGQVGSRLSRRQFVQGVGVAGLVLAPGRGRRPLELSMTRGGEGTRRLSEESVQGANSHG
jgi:hypothetical protein